MRETGIGLLGLGTVGSGVLKIYEQHRAIRDMFQQGRRRPWADWNQDAIREWLRDHPAYAERPADA